MVVVVGTGSEIGFASMLAGFWGRQAAKSKAGNGETHVKTKPGKTENVMSADFPKEDLPSP